MLLGAVIDGLARRIDQSGLLWKPIFWNCCPSCLGAPRWQNLYPEPPVHLQKNIKKQLHPVTGWFVYMTIALGIQLLSICLAVCLALAFRAFDGTSHP